MSGDGFPGRFAMTGKTYLFDFDRLEAVVEKINIKCAACGSTVNGKELIAHFYACRAIPLEDRAEMQGIFCRLSALPLDEFAKAMASLVGEDMDVFMKEGIAVRIGRDC